MERVFPGTIARGLGLVLLSCCLGALCFGAVAGRAFAAEPAAEAREPETIELFARTGCPHCADAEAFLTALAAERPGLTIVVRPVDRDPEARARLEALAAADGASVGGVPALYVRGRLLFGFDSAQTTGARVRALLGAPRGPPAGASDAAGAEDGLCPPSPDAPCEPERDVDTMDLPLVGRISATRLGLPLFTVVVGLLDGFNPCAMWVLLFLLSLLVNLKSRPRMALVAGTFVLVSGVIYFAFMAAWLNVFLLVGYSRSVQVALGLVALLVGGLNVKERFAFHRGPSLTIPERAKPGLYARMRRVLTAEHLPGALAAVTVLAVLVNMVELLCTAGFPAVYTHILTARQLPAWQNYLWLGVYNLAYIADDALMVGVAVYTLSRRRLEEGEGRWLKLVSGLVMLALGGVLLFRPGWLAALG